jgi:hypothetical protein
MKQSIYYCMFFMLLLLSNSYFCSYKKRNAAGSKSNTNQFLILESPQSKSSNSKHNQPSPFLGQRKNDKKEITVTESNDETAVEFTLQEIKVDNNHKLDSYYPYFYKTHIIEYQDNIDYKVLSSECRDVGCQWCDTNSKMICSECHHGFFLFDQKCYTSCPDGYTADVFKKSCNKIQNTSITQVVYLKAFSVGSCKNLCGGKSIDCSCHPSCASKGDCCSDYQDCQNLELVNKNRISECISKIPNCEKCLFPLNGSMVCAQCSNGFFLRNGSCVNSCFPSDKMIDFNRICLKNQDCRVENCSDCVDGNPSICRRCMNGHYMHNNQCIDSCPLKFRADRISWSCLQAPVFAWYWVFPSVTSCSKRCGAVVAHDMDCSCSQDCFRFGNCCQDIEDFCPELLFWK